MKTEESIAQVIDREIDQSGLKFCGIIPSGVTTAKFFKRCSRMRDPSNTILPTSKIEYEGYLNCLAFCNSKKVHIESCSRLSLKNSPFDKLDHFN